MLISLVIKWDIKLFSSCWLNFCDYMNELQQKHRHWHRSDERNEWETSLKKLFPFVSSRQRHKYTVCETTGMETRQLCSELLLLRFKIRCWTHHKDSDELMMNKRPFFDQKSFDAFFNYFQRHTALNERCGIIFHWNLSWNEIFLQETVNCLKKCQEQTFHHFISSNIVQGHKVVSKSRQK